MYRIVKLPSASIIFLGELIEENKDDKWSNNCF